MTYYYFKYPALHETKQSFQNTMDQAFYQLAKRSIELNLTPFVQDDVYLSHGEGNKFFEVAYFDKPLKIWKLGQPLPSGSILLTQLELLEGAENIQADIKPLSILKID